MLPASQGEIAIFLAVRTTANGQRLADWIRDVADLKRSTYVPAIARFSDPPRLDDLRTLELDDQDLTAIRACRPGSCDLKLTAADMTSLQDAIRSAGQNWRPALQEAFRRLVLRHVTQYLATGDAGMAPTADHGRPTSFGEVFSRIVADSPFLTQHAPDLSTYLIDYPRASLQGAESFLYWSKERIGGRPSIDVTHVVMLAPGGAGPPETIVAGKQIFASHYVDASLNITAIVGGPSPGERYLVYLNRSRVNVLDRWYGGLARMLIGRRLKGDAADVFRGLKARLEGGEPPG